MRAGAFEAAFDGGAVTSNGGALLLGATERAIGLVAGFARCFQDGRDPALTEHSVATLVGQRVFALALGYEDLIDHDELRHDPVMAVLAGKLEARRADCAPLAGKSTLNRLEHAPSGAPSRYHKIGHDAAAIERQFVALFLAAHRRPAKQIIIDLDATDDPLHGEQEDRFFHGYYDCYCYLPLYIFCGRHLLAAKLRPANIDGAAGAIEELARIVEQIRDDWPDVRILVRADSGFAREALMAWCEANRVDYVFGLARNKRLSGAIEDALAAAAADSRRTGKPARRYQELVWTTRKSWSRERRVVAKAEWTHGKANPRFVVTSLGTGEVKARNVAQLDRELDGNAFNVAVVFVDPSDTQKGLAGWRRKFGNPDWLVALDNPGDSIARGVQLRYLDSKYLLDADGVIRDIDFQIAGDAYLETIRSVVADAR